MSLSFCLEDVKACRDGRLLYIPCNRANELGYICIDGFGIPLGYSEPYYSSRVYWLGMNTFQLVDVKAISTMLFYIGKPEESNDDNLRLSLIFSYGGMKPSRRFIIQFDFRKGFYCFCNGVLDSQWLQLHRIPVEKLAAYYILTP